MTKLQELALNRAVRVARWIWRYRTTPRGEDLTKTNPHLALTRSIGRMQDYAESQAAGFANRGVLSAALDREAKHARHALAKLDPMVRLARMYDRDALAEWNQAKRFRVPAWRAGAHRARTRRGR